MGEQVMFYRTDDPVADFERHDRECQERLDKLPKCADCGEPIQDDHYYLICDEAICPDCLEAGYRKENEI